MTWQGIELEMKRWYVRKRFDRKLEGGIKVKKMERGLEVGRMERFDIWEDVFRFGS